jgi:hypothetical protein
MNPDDSPRWIDVGPSQGAVSGHGTIAGAAFNDGFVDNNGIQFTQPSKCRIRDQQVTALFVPLLVGRNLLDSSQDPTFAEFERERELLCTFICGAELFADRVGGERKGAVTPAEPVGRKPYR